jgi:predicted AAA+ superfamily ATPase
MPKNIQQLSIDSLSQVISDSIHINTDYQITRKTYFDWLTSSTDNEFIKVITGFRRVGKSFLLKQLHGYLTKEKQIPAENIFFINFEHDLIQFRNVEGLRKMWELFKENLPDPNAKVYLFLDEIQNIKGWEKFVRTLYDSAKNKYNIFITGSNSSLLSSEFSSALSGRTIEMHIHSFDFKEFLLLKKIKPRRGLARVEQKSLLQKNLNQYLHQGGLPETINKSNQDTTLYIQSIFNKILLDDIIERFNIKKSQSVKNLLAYLFSNIGSVLSFSKIEKILANEGENISSTTLYEYADMYIQSFALSKISKFDWKTKRIFKKQHKFYASDNGLITSLDYDHIEAKDVLLENLIYIALSKKHSNIYYGRDERNHEIDFVIPNKKKNSFLKIQATLELNAENEKRELGNFTLVNKHLPAGKNILITLHGENRTHKFKNVTIQEIPLLDFLLNNN